MDITDIFDEAKPAATSPHPAAHLPCALVAQAEETARAHDDAVSTQRIYSLERDRLLAELDAKLDALKTEADAAAARATEMTASLKKSMETAQISQIPLPDRGPICIKIYAGKKKNVTKTYLESVLDAQTAAMVWEKVGNTDPTHTLVIPPRYEDEPPT